MRTSKRLFYCNQEQKLFDFHSFFVDVDVDVDDRFRLCIIIYQEKTVMTGIAKTQSDKKELFDLSGL